jgi:hypothetical protein
MPLWTGAGTLQVNDIEWYGDRELLALAKTSREGFGLYRLSVPRGPEGEATVEAFSAERIALLREDMIGARGLSVGPDRQLVTFLAPLSDIAPSGQVRGTDIYAIRPDGSDMRLLVSHTEPVSPHGPGGNRVFSPDSQAVKSYVWTEGHLEYEGYSFGMLLTCGDGSSPTFYRGGFLYSAPGRLSGALLDHEALGVADGTKMQIVHVAYSAHGKVAMTGYYNDRDGRSDKLAGLWMADVVGGALANVESLPIPAGPNGIADLQWSADGRSLIYRETMPQGLESRSDRYDGQSPFRMMKLNTEDGSTVVLYQ